MALFLPPLLWLGLLYMPVPEWAREGNLAIAYPYLLSGVWFAAVAVLFP